LVTGSSYMASMSTHPGRDGEILEVRGEDGGPPYVVRWSDNGHEALVFPGPDAVVQHCDQPAGSAPSGS